MEPWFKNKHIIAHLGMSLIIVILVVLNITKNQRLENVTNNNETSEYTVEELKNNLDVLEQNLKQVQADKESVEANLHQCEMLKAESASQTVLSTSSEETDK